MHRLGCMHGSRLSEMLTRWEKERNICRLRCRVNATYLSLAGAACHGTKIKTRHTRPAHVLAHGAQKRSGTDTASTLGLRVFSSPFLFLCHVLDFRLRDACSSAVAVHELRVVIRLVSLGFHLLFSHVSLIHLLTF